MDYDRQTLAALFAECDRHDAECAAAEARREQLKTRTSSADLVYKRRDNALSQPQRAVTMDTETEARWNEWYSKSFAAHIKPAFARYSRHIEKDLMKAIGQFTSDYVFKRLEQEKKTLRDEFDEKLAGLRTEVEVLRGVVKNFNVTPIHGDRDAA